MVSLDQSDRPVPDPIEYSHSSFFGFLLAWSSSAGGRGLLPRFFWFDNNKYLSIGVWHRTRIPPLTKRSSNAFFCATAAAFLSSAEVSYDGP